MQDTEGTSLSRRDGAGARYRLIFLAVALVAYLLDLGTKLWALERLQGRPDIAVLGDWLKLHFTSNPGAAFSAGTEFTPVITCVAIVASLVLLWFARRLGSIGWAVALGFLFAGITGNLTDRLARDPKPFHGEVIDMIQLPNWPVFNVADICINIAAALIVVQAFRGIHLDGAREGSRDAETEPIGQGAEE